jgi:hypothetical protein
LVYSSVDLVQKEKVVTPSPFTAQISLSRPILFGKVGRVGLGLKEKESVGSGNLKSK